MVLRKKLLILGAILIAPVFLGYYLGYDQGFEKGVKQNKELVSISLDVPIKIDWDELKLKTPDNKRLYKLFKELEFKTLLKELTLPEKNLKKPCFAQDGGKCGKNT